MSNGRSELLVFLAATFATTIGLLVVQQGYASFIDMRYHAQLSEQPSNAARLVLRQEEADKLESGGKISIERAIAALGEKGRNGFGSIAAQQSDDLAPISGWIQAKGFKPAVAHPIRTPRAPAAEPVAVPAVVEPVPAPALEPAPVAPKKPARRAAAPAPAAPTAAPAAQ